MELHDMPKALICGVTGQDGACLARLLLGKGYEVWGTSRYAQTSSFANFNQLGLAGRVRTMSMAPSDFRSVLPRIRGSHVAHVAG